MCETASAETGLGLRQLKERKDGNDDPLVNEICGCFRCFSTYYIHKRLRL